MENDWAHIDIGNQIDNSWNKDTALALKLNKITYSVKIREMHKKQIESKYIKDKSGDGRKLEKQNRKVVVLIYSFLLYKLLTESNGIADKFKLCNDISPGKDVYRYLNLICKYFERELLEKTMKIRFKKRADGSSKAHAIANRTYKGRAKEDYLIKSKDMDDLKMILKKVLGLK